MLIEICIPDRTQYNIAKQLFEDIPEINVANKSITQATYPTIISAGNSFGEMNGGVDKIINLHLSSYTPDKYISDIVKQLIANYYIGELPVGQSIILRAAHPTHKYLVYTPTMRVAEDVSGTLNAYLAFRGSLLCLKNNKITSASTPLFCTGAGCMDIKRACLQMKEAYLSVANGNLLQGDWMLYHVHHRHLQSL
jgi:O-acetyl-ADP-ribose deacetylase (regulator of RNase III)